jgi:hypothetical protein
MKVGLAADHAGFEMKPQLGKLLAAEGHEVIDFGNTVFDANDGYPDFTIRLARAVSRGDVERGVLLCGSGVGASTRLRAYARRRTMSNLNTQWDVNHRDDVIESCAPNGRGLPCTSLRGSTGEPAMSDQALDAYPAFKARCEEAIVMPRRRRGIRDPD